MKAKSFDRKNELIEAAIDEFTNKKYEDASLNNIIKKAGISKGTFYYHFKDKEALYLFLLESFVEAKIDFLDSRIKEYHIYEQSDDIFELFKAQGRIGVEFAKHNPRYYRFGMMFLNEKGNGIYETREKMLGSNSEKIFEEMIDKAIENKDFRGDIPKDFILKIISLLLTRYYEIFNMDTDLDFDNMLLDLDQLIDFMKFGFGKGGEI